MIMMINDDNDNPHEDDYDDLKDDENYGLWQKPVADNFAVLNGRHSPDPHL